MALILPLRGFTPRIGRDCFLAETPQSWVTS